MQMKSSGKTPQMCDLRLPMQLRYLDTDFLVIMAHIVGGEDDGDCWAIFPATSNDLAIQYLDKVRLYERLGRKQALILLLCLVVEYASRAQEQQGNEEAENYFNKLRQMTIDAIKKFFPMEEKTLSELRLSNVQSQMYHELASQAIFFRAFLAGRLFQFHVERAIDAEIAKANGQSNIS